MGQELNWGWGMDASEAQGVGSQICTHEMFL